MSVTERLMGVGSWSFVLENDESGDLMSSSTPSIYLAGARATDPETSHEAAASLSEQEINRTQLRVLFLLVTYGPMTDRELVSRYVVEAERKCWTIPTDSSIRTRRHELMTGDDPLVAFAGYYRRPGRTRQRVWAAL